MRTRFTKKKLAKAAAGALVGLSLAVFPGLLPAQERPADPPASSEGPSFEVLDVTTGLGSRSQEDRSPIEVLDLTPKSPEAAAEAAREAAEADPGLTPAQREAKAREAALATALEMWQIQTLDDYTYNITSLEDPFMPIREVRGRQDGPLDDPNASEFSSLPPILRLELNQLKLVAITTPSGGSGFALAAFEDGAGVSYILRRGDRVGRREGRIIGITPTTVTVEEPSKAPGTPPRVTEIRLSTADTRGLTRLGGQVDEAMMLPPEAAAMGGEEQAGNQ
ncbi:MAG: hypothetical protein FWG97_04120 [Deltaproteobacteria bacterium]|nr:hypothetical protein [Deltaproteobacteria bacterium]